MHCLVRMCSSTSCTDLWVFWQVDALPQMRASKMNALQHGTTSFDSSLNPTHGCGHTAPLTISYMDTCREVTRADESCYPATLKAERSSVGERLEKSKRERLGGRHRCEQMLVCMQKLTHAIIYAMLPS